MKHVVAFSNEDGHPFCAKCSIDLDHEEAALSECKYGTEVENKICPHCRKTTDHLVYNPVCQLYECDVCRYLHR